MAENKEYVFQGQEKGAIRISEDVISSIAITAANEQEGVREIEKKKDIKLVVSPNGIRVTIKITVYYGASVLDVAKKVQEAVTESITAMTGLNVLQVNVQISGVCSK